MKHGENRFATFDILNIDRGITVEQKAVNKVGPMVPPFINPAFIYTLELFDLVFWYGDQFPSLGVAQVPADRAANAHGP